MLSGDFGADGLVDEEWWGHAINDSRGSAGAATLFVENILHQTTDAPKGGCWVSETQGTSTFWSIPGFLARDFVNDPAWFWTVRKARQI